MHKVLLTIIILFNCSTKIFAQTLCNTPITVCDTSYNESTKKWEISCSEDNFPNICFDGLLEGELVLGGRKAKKGTKPFGDDIITLLKELKLMFTLQNSNTILVTPTHKDNPLNTFTLTKTSTSIWETGKMYNQKEVKSIKRALNKPIASRLNKALSYIFSAYKISFIKK